MTGKEFRAARKRLDMTQAEFADLLGLTANHVAKLERGATGVKESLAKLVGMLVVGHAPTKKAKGGKT